MLRGILVRNALAYQVRLRERDMNVITSLSCADRRAKAEWLDLRKKS
jgi:hypothetical protein